MTIKKTPAEKPDEEKSEAELEAEANAAAKAEAEAAEKAAKEGEEAPESDKGEEETPPSESAPESDKTPKSGKETTPKSLDNGEGDKPGEDSAHLKPRTQKRIKALSKKAKQAKSLAAENAFLRQQLKIPAGKPLPPLQSLPGPTPAPAPTPTKPTGKLPVAPGKLPWESDKPGEPRELTQEEFDSEVAGKATEKAGEIVDSKLKGFELLNTLRQDIWYVEQKFTELYAGKVDPATGQVSKPNPDYDSDLAGNIVGWYRKLSAADPNLRFLVFVNKLMGLRTKSAEKAEGKVTETVAKQAAKQALVPTGTPTKGKGDKTLTDMIASAETEEELAKIEEHLPQVK